MLEFVVRRLEQILVDGGITVEAVRAALAERSHNPCLAASTARSLQVHPTPHRIHATPLAVQSLLKLLKL